MANNMHSTEQLGKWHAFHKEIPIVVVCSSSFIYSIIAVAGRGDLGVVLDEFGLV